MVKYLSPQLTVGMRRHRGKLGPEWGHDQKKEKKRKFWVKLWKEKLSNESLGPWMLLPSFSLYCHLKVICICASLLGHNPAHY